MDTKVRKKDLLIGVIYFLLAVFAIYVLVYDLTTYDGPSWFYHPLTQEEIAKAVIPSASLFMYFTYLTMLFFAVWGVCLFLGKITDWQALKKVVDNDYVLLTLTLFSAVTFAVYFACQVFSPLPFGFEGTQKSQIISFVFGLCMHVLFPASAMVYYFVINTPKNLNFKKSLSLVSVFVVYAVAVKLIGKFCFNVEWYPYAVFTPKGMWQVLPIGGEYNETLMNFVLLAVGVLFIVLVVLLIFLFVKYANVKCAKSHNKKTWKKNG